MTKKITKNVKKKISVAAPKASSYVAPEFAFIANENFITIIGDKEISVTKGDARFAQVKLLLKAKKFQQIADLLDRPAAIERYSKGAVKVYDGLITYNGEEIHGAIVERILQFIKEGLPFEPLVNFLNNLHLNTSVGVRNKLFSFLERNNLGITDQGKVVAYKLVKPDGSPNYHAGEFYETQGGKAVKVSKYRVGYEYTYPRSEIKEGQAECGTVGLYLGNKSYWNGSFNEKNEYTGGGHLLIAEVDPKDVCDVAHSETSKMVVCKMKLVGEYKTLHKAVNRALVKTSSFGIKPGGSKFHNVRDAKGHFVKTK